MKTESIVTKSRKWHYPEILAYVNNQEIGLQIKLDDYLRAIVEEIGNPAFIVTKGALLAKLRAASVEVEAEMHEKSAAIV